MDVWPVNDRPIRHAVRDFGRTERGQALPGLPESIARQAHLRPDALAVVEPSGTVNYAELDARVDRVAQRVRPLLPAPETPVAIRMPRSADALAAVAGVMRAGGCSVLLNPSDPPERVRVMLDDAAPAAVITERALVADLPARAAPLILLDEDAEDPAGAVPAMWPTRPESLCYVVYTSGSTGTPKAVGGCQGSVANLMDWEEQAYGITPADRSTWVSPPSFGAFPAEVWAFLAAGATVHIPSDEAKASPIDLRDWMVDNRITVTYVVRGLADRLDELAWPAEASLRLIIATGERFLRWPARESPFEYIMTYGSSEMLNITSCRDTEGRRLITRLLPEGEEGRDPSCGWPMTGRTVHVLDEHMRPVAPGELGELYIGGTHLFRGYLGRPGASAERLVPDPFGAPGRRLFRSGDMGRLAPDGTLEVLGRVDEQVKIRGYRVEPGEVERCLREHEAVTDAAVLTETTGSGTVRLLAFAACAGVDGDTLRGWTAERLPEPLVPRTVHVMEELPRNANGKIDRVTLPGLVRSVPSPTTGSATPSPHAAAIAGLCAHLLDVPVVGSEENLYELGADSLILMRLVTSIAQLFGAEVGLRDLHGSPTVSAIAALVAAAGRQNDPVPSVAPSPEDADEPFPLTDTQHAYWIGRDSQVELGGVGCHGYFEWEREELDVERLQDAFRQLIARHGMLRAVVAPDGSQCVLSEVPPLSVHVDDLRGRERSAVAEALEATREEMAHQVFDPAVWPLYAARVTLTDQGVRLHLSFDLLIADAWSYFAIIIPELDALYESPDSLPPAPTIGFRDYVMAEDRLRDTEAYRESERYWHERLPSLPPPPKLPKASARPAGEVRFERWQSGLDAVAWRALRAKATARGLTPAAALTAVFAEVLRHWTGQERFTLNVPLFNRLPVHADVDGVVGDFTTVTLLAVEPVPGTFADRARALCDQLTQDLDHRRYGGTRVLRELARTGSHGDLVTMPIVITPLLGTPRAPRSALGEPVYGITQTPQTELDYQIYEDGEELRYSWDALAALFPEGLLDDMFAAHAGLLERLAHQDSAWEEVSFALTPERQLVHRRAVNATARPLPDRLLADHLAEHALLRPDHPAVVDDLRGRTLGYRELHDRAAALASELVATGARPGEAVAVAMERGWQQFTAAVAVIMAGCAHLPVDPGLPERRVLRMLADAGVRHVVTASETGTVPVRPGESMLHHVPEDHPAAPAPPPRRVGLDDPAYVLFTSGSTGEPNGVVIPHRGIMNTALDVNRRFGVGSEDRIIAVSSPSFDLSAYDMFGGLIGGATIVVPAHDRVRDPAYLADVGVRHRVTLWNSVPTLAQMLVEHLENAAPSDPPPLRTLLLSGDRIPVSLPERLTAVLPGARTISLGGPTETSVWSVFHVIGTVGDDQVRITYGRPLANCSHRVLDRDMADCPDWTPGEIYTGGFGVGTGYVGRDELTRERFVDHPQDGARLFRTGDIGFFTPEGDLEILGRRDQQAKIQGHRVEPAEIEAELGDHPDVAACAVVVSQGPDDRRFLVAHVACRPPLAPRELSAGSLTDHLRSRLPSALIPVRFLVTDRLPLTPNGKVDRARLARTAPPPPSATPPPQGPTESALADIWAQLLGLTSVGRTDDFFHLGGDSLVATRMTGRVRSELRRDITVGAVFGAPLLKDLATRVDAAAPLDAAPHTTLRGADEARPGLREASPAQRRLWFLDRLRPESAAYNLTSAMNIRGDLDTSALRNALDEIVRRHPALRTVFEERRGRVWERVLDHRPVELRRTDLADLPPDERASALAALAADHAATRFDLDEGPLHRFALARLGRHEHALLQTFHHLVFDGHSLELLRVHLGDLYEDFAAGRPPHPFTTPGDAAHSKRSDLSAREREDLVTYWTDTLEGAPRLLDVADRPRPPVVTQRGSTMRTTTVAALGELVDSFARSMGTTPFTVYAAAFAVLLGRHVQRDDIVLGTPMSERGDDPGALGFFVNTVLLRLDLGGAPTFREVVGRARRVAAGAQEHQGLPFDTLVEALRPERGLDRNPLFQVMFSYEDTELRPIEAAGLRVDPPQVVHQGAKVDLTLTVTRSVDGPLLRWEYATDLLDERTVARFDSELGTLLRTSLERPDLPVPVAGSKPENRRNAPVGSRPKHGAVPGPGGPDSLAARFAAWAARTPDAPAVLDGGNTWTYRELADRSRTWSRALTARGADVERLVGLCLHRSFDLIAAQVAVAWSGAAYLPLDPTSPTRHLHAITAQARPEFVLVDDGVHAAAFEGTDIPAVPLTALDTAPTDGTPYPAAPATGQALAYVIFTSGSTGTPKGVGVTSDNAVRLFDATAELGLSSRDRLALGHSPAFDFSVWEIWGALTNGASVVVVPEDTARDARALHDLVRAKGVTVLGQTPSAFDGFASADLEADRDRTDLRLVVLGGEEVVLPRLAGWFERHGDTRPEVVNMYGITETTVHATARRLRRQDLDRPARSPIGRALPDLSTHILDADLRPVAPGGTGEVYVGGAGVSRGYLGRPAETAERFLPDPWSLVPGSRMYRSGDLVRVHAGGEHDYAGRSDRQLNVRGFRVEAREVEVALLAGPHVAEAAVVGRLDATGRPQAFAYVTESESGAVRDADLRAVLLTRLPAHMVPAAIAVVPRMPRTANGKLDVGALPDLTGSTSTAPGTHADTETPEERLLMSTWEDVLGCGPILADDNFFALGGDSMRIVEVVSRLHDHGVPLSIRDVYGHPTPRALARLAASRPSGPAEPGHASTGAFSLLSGTDRDRLLARSNDDERRR
ncbi:amino acid adenylation domain-containing protein [Nocardiopsis sp. Huas11]|nr:amino acid adenylation domain-containing protein [Nocardiopsis sp. Huas11]